jgi:hypothetical protein
LLLLSSLPSRLGHAPLPELFDTAEDNNDNDDDDGDDDDDDDDGSVQTIMDEQDVDPNVCVSKQNIKKEAFTSARVHAWTRDAAMQDGAAKQARHASKQARTHDTRRVQTHKRTDKQHCQEQQRHHERDAKFHGVEGWMAYKISSSGFLGVGFDLLILYSNCLR